MRKNRRKIFIKKSSKSGKRSVCERWTDKNKEKARKKFRRCLSFSCCFFIELSIFLCSFLNGNFTAKYMICHPSKLSCQTFTQQKKIKHKRITWSAVWFRRKANIFIWIKIILWIIKRIYYHQTTMFRKINKQTKTL